MSSGPVRDAINEAVAVAAAPWQTFDLSDYVTLEDCLADIDSHAILIQYIDSGENIVTIGGEGNQGYEESGSVVVHMVVATGFASAPTVAKGDEIRLALRGRRIEPSVILEQVDPFTDFGAGSTGLYGGAWHGWASNILYVRRDCG
jgi:hypothetical protein